MLHMSKRKARPRGEPSLPQTPNRSGENLNVWIRADLVEALRRWLETTRPRVTKTAAVEEALEVFLSQRGCWPISEDAGE